MAQNIQGNSWTDEPELPNTKREGNKQNNEGAKPAQQPQGQEPSSVQRPPADS